MRDYRFVWKIAVSVSLLASVGCDDDDGDDGTDGGTGVECGAGTVEEAGECVATCGPNTSLGDDGCEIEASACGVGSTLNPDNSTCEIADTPPGELIATSGTAQNTAYPNFNFLAYLDGDTPTPLAVDFYENPAVPDDTVMVHLSGIPTNQGLIPVSTFALSEQIAHMLADVGGEPGDTQFTVGDLKACNQDLKVFRLANGLLRFRYTLTQCFPSQLFTVWFTFGPTYPEDPTDLDQVIEAQRPAYASGVAGGFPSAFVTNPDGFGVKEFDVDPAFWFQIGEPPCGGESCSGIPPIGPPPQTPTVAEGAIYFDLSWHSTGQTNGNAGSCYMRDDGTCIQDQSEVDLTPPFNDHVIWTGRLAQDAAHIASCVLAVADLQP